MSEKDLKLTDLDYATGDHRLQMLKAAIPYMGIGEQRALSFFVKWNELRRTMDFFKENGDGMLSVCALDEGHTSPADMLSAMKPFANQREQEVIDLLSGLLAGKKGGGPSLSPETLKTLLPPEQQTRLETLELMLQAFGQK